MGLDKYLWYIVLDIPRLGSFERHATEDGMTPGYVQWVRTFLNHLLVQKNYSRHTFDAYHNDLNQLVAFLEERVSGFAVDGWRTVTEDHLRDYAHHLYQCGYANASIARKLATVRSFFQYLQAEGAIPHDPSMMLEGPKVERPLPRAISPEEITRLLEAPSQVNGPKGVRDRAILELLYATGMRVSELADLRLSDVDLERNVVRCRGKGNKERLIPVHELAAKWLLAYIEEARPELLGNKKTLTDVLFLNYRGQPLTRQGLWLIIRQYAKIAGLTTPVTPHVLRHSVATHLLRNGAGLREVQELLGHTNMNTTQQYTRLLDDHLRETYDETHPRA